ncbi:OsmC family protein [Nocardioides euryhalodurans]|uniref:OsmC family peroxiredoxin n=1 Tax=Nocardioides euryhalodurans TaxID=2518370 RepID=A0A4P7GH98_9ACTN|nr:OsmC family protein [Nocardioides euryhalodurans]QBR91225.1 OsmC family peroxiredoxin [Nocardioides euryhalodurans]
MSDQPDSLRQIELTKIGEGRYKATNARGGETFIGSGGEDPDFSPVELLLAALAGCGAIDVDLITRKRAPAEALTVRASGHKVRDEHGNHLVNLSLAFDLTFPEGEGGDAARAVLPRSLEQTRDRLCTVSRTVALGEPVAFSLAGEASADRD